MLHGGFTETNQLLEVILMQRVKYSDNIRRVYVCVCVCVYVRARMRVTFPPSVLNSSCSMSQPDNYGYVQKL
jgi:hypothetical protein